MSKTSAQIIREAKKEDLYGYITKIKETKMDEVNKKYSEKLKDLNSKMTKYYKPLSEEVVDALETAMKTYEEFVDVLGNEDLVKYNFSNIFYQMDWKIKSHYRGSVKSDILDDFTLTGSRKDLRESDSETIKEYKRENNDIQNQYKQERDEIIKLHKELYSIIKSATRGSVAWTNLEEVGLDLKPLEARLMKSGNFLPVAVKTSVDISLYNDVAKGMNKKESDK